MLFPKKKKRKKKRGLVSGFVVGWYYSHVQKATTTKNKTFDTASLMEGIFVTFFFIQPAVFSASEEVVVQSLASNTTKV